MLDVIYTFEHRNDRPFRNEWDYSPPLPRYSDPISKLRCGGLIADSVLAAQLAVQFQTIYDVQIRGGIQTGAVPEC